MLFRAIRKTPHYKFFHEKSFPWSDVVQEIFSSKQKRRKGNRIEIKRDKVYILCKIEKDVLYVINAKRK